MTVRRSRQIFKRTRSRLTIVYAGLWSIVVIAAAIVFWNAFDRFDRFYLANHAHFDEEFHKVEAASKERATPDGAVPTAA